jgi:hypothetical protein
LYRYLILVLSNVTTIWISTNPVDVAENLSNSFDINGQYLYPSLVSAVQLGGVPLSFGNYSPKSDTLITVTLPGTTDTGQYSVGVQTMNPNIQSNTFPIQVNQE